MNYRHIYHAGNFADVFKHAVLALLVEYLTRKEKPFVVMDTHAGIGLYDLASDEAQRTGEYRNGIERLLAAPHPPACLSAYLAIVRALNQGGGLQRYPGSPWIMRQLMRRTDRLDLAELHPADCATLTRLFEGDRRVRVYEIDGYRMLKAFLPPRERRGLVLIDAPFEQPDEFGRLLQGLLDACRRWASGVYALWYPVKDPSGVAAFHDALRDEDRLPHLLMAELAIGPAHETGLQHCGMIIANPPWLLYAQLQECLPFLAEVLGRGRGSWRLEWLRPEKQKAGAANLPRP